LSALALAPAGARAAVWVSPSELSGLPMAGPAWDALKATADAPLGTADIASQNSMHDVNTLAAALVYARTGDTTYRLKAAQGISAAIGTEAGGRTLALARNLPGYVIAADLVDLPWFDPLLEVRFRNWLSAVRSEDLAGLTLISTNETRPNNWGTLAGAARVAADLYLDDTADLARAAQVFAGWLGDRAAYASFSYGALDWQADPDHPVGVDPVGAVVSSFGVLGTPVLSMDADGALPEEMRRGCAPSDPPCRTGYPWEALQGAVLEADLLARHGYDAWSWSDQALRRAVAFLQRLDARYGGWWTSGDDGWVPWTVDAAYGASFPTTAPAGKGKNLAFTDWVYGAGSASPPAPTPPTPPAPPTATFTAVSDAQIRSDRPSANYGALPKLRVRLGPASSATYRAYVKFVVSGVTRPVTHATLRLTLASGKATGDGVYTVSNALNGTSTPWNDANLTWSSAPSLEGPPIARVAGGGMDVDLGSAITGDGTYSFAISGASSASAYFKSREAGGGAPQLILTLG
jgi:hypothetical protein